MEERSEWMLVEGCAGVEPSPAEVRAWSAEERRGLRFWEEVLVLVSRSSNVDLYHDDLVGIITCTADVGNVFSYLGPLLLLAAPWALLFPL